MMTASPNLRKLFWILIGLNVLWAPVNWAVQTADAVASPAAIGLIRFSCFALVLWAAIGQPQVKRKLKVKLPKGRDAWSCVLVGLFLVGPAHGIYYSALKTATTAETSAINTTGPFFTTLFAILLLGERVTKWRWLAIGGAVIGAYFVAMGFEPPSFEGNQGGNMLYMVGTLLECLGFVIATRMLRRSSGVGVLAYEMTGVAFAMVLWPLILPSVFPISMGAISPEFTFALSYLILVAGVFCFGVWYAIAEKAPVSLMLVTLGMQAPTAAVIGVLALGERISSGLLVGTSIILLALGLGAWDARRKEESEPEAPDLLPAPEPVGS